MEFGSALNNVLESSLRSLFLTGTPLIDVRAPVEFEQGSLPGAVNLPIMYNEERVLVGTTYKIAGHDKAVSLGHELVSGAVRELRIKMWMDFIQQNPSAVLYCFRGGLRSQITQRWLREQGLELPLIEGGFKKARGFLRAQMESFAHESAFLMLTGPTGSAKTHVLNQAMTFYPGLDLEEVAKHRGSAFGAYEVSQPSQVDFENLLAVQFLRLSDKSQGQKILLEDESRLIGRRALPEILFQRMRDSEVLFLEEDFDQRVENIFQDYILRRAIGQGAEAQAVFLFRYYQKATQAISKKLGGLRTQEILGDLAEAERSYLQHRDLTPNKTWIAKLLSYYYDPLYASSLKKRAPKILIRGGAKTILDFLRNFPAGC